MATPQRRAIVCGGSIGGLFAACALQQAGWQVDVFERTPVPLSGRGAGIVTHAQLIDALKSVGADTSELGVGVRERVAYDLQGARVAEFEYAQIVTSWDRMFQVLRHLIPDAHYHMGAAATGYVSHADGVEVQFADGAVREADLLVGTDGFRSAIRAQMLPEVKPEYAGYVVWRTLAAEADLPDHVRGDIFKTFGYFIPNGTQIIGYPIAGANNDLRPGHLRYNFVWYAEVGEAHLADMLTDGDGVHHDVSIPPPLIRGEIIAKMYEDANARLPKPFNDILKVSERPFFTPIYDHHSPVMAEGRAALAGDAACVARPHVGMGVTKAGEDALSLAKHLDAGTITEGLRAYSSERVAASKIAYDRARLLGRYMLAGAETGENKDGRTNLNMDAIMKMTAVVP